MTDPAARSGVLVASLRGAVVWSRSGSCIARADAGEAASSDDPACFAVGYNGIHRAARRE
jgi:hypothetical protein